MKGDIQQAAINMTQYIKILTKVEKVSKYEREKERRRPCVDN